MKAAVTSWIDGDEKPVRMKRWSGGDMRCQKCNKYLPDRCTCNGPSIEEQRSMTHEPNPNRAPAAPDQPAAIWLSTPHPHDRDWVQAKWFECNQDVFAFAKACAPVPASTGREPTYIVRYAGHEGWREASEEAYHLFSEGNRRIMYASPVAARELDADAERRALSKRLREHNDPRLYREADVLMSEAADALDRATAESAP